MSMTDEQFYSKLADARARINALPEEQRLPLLTMLAETQQRHEEMKQNFAKIHDSLAEWQLMIKYLIFDREATRRERDDLRRKLDSQGS